MKSFSLMGLVRGLVTALVIFFATAAVFSFISLKLDDPSKYLSLFSGIVLALAVFLGACAASRNGNFLTGLVFGIVFLIAHRAVGALWFEEGDFSWMKTVIILLSAVAGSIFHKKRGASVSSDRRRKNIRRRYGRSLG